MKQKLHIMHIMPWQPIGLFDDNRILLVSAIRLITRLGKQPMLPNGLVLMPHLNKNKNNLVISILVTKRDSFSFLIYTYINICKHCFLSQACFFILIKLEPPPSPLFFSSNSLFVDLTSSGIINKYTKKKESGYNYPVKRKEKERIQKKISDPIHQ